MATIRSSGQLTLTDMNDVIASDTKPSNPIDGTLWWNTAELKLYVYSTAISDWKFSADGLEVGGRNLRQEIEPQVNNSSFTDIEVETAYIYAGTKSWGLGAKTTDLHYWRISSPMSFNANMEYTASFYLYDPNNYRGMINYVDNNGSPLKLTYSFTEIGSGYYRGAITYTPRQDGVPSHGVLLYGAGTMPIDGTFPMYISGIKVERGNIATDWTPAPEDTQTQIDDINVTLGNMANDSLIDITERQTVKDKLTGIIGYAIADASTTLPTTTTLDSSLKGSFYNSRKSALNAGLLTSDSNYTNLATKYNALKTYLEGLTPIDTWDVSVTNKDSNITVTKSTWRDAWQAYYQAEADLDTATAKKLKDNVDNVDVGGRNLFIFKTLNNVVDGTSTESIKLSGWADTLVDNATVLNTLVAGKQYTLSFDAELIEKTTVPTLYSRQTGLYLYSPATANDVIFYTTNLVNIGDKARVEQTFTCPPLTDQIILFYTNRYSTSGVAPYGDDTVRFTNLKLEIGNKATGWTPSPEDTANDLGDAVGAVTTEYQTAISDNGKSITLEVNKTLYGDPSDPNDTGGLKGEMIDYTDAKITTTENSFDVKFTEIKTTQGTQGDQLTEVYSYFDFNPTGLNIGKSDSPLQINISNEEMDFLDNGNVVAYINGQKMFIDTAEILDSIVIGNHRIEKYNNVITLIKWVGN